MSSDHTDLPPHLETLLQEVCVGDRQQDDPAVIAARQAHPAFGAELDAMLATMQTMGAAATTERETLKDEPEYPAFQGAAQTRLRAVATPRHNRRWHALTLAALLLLGTPAVIWMAGGFGGTTASQLEFLGGEIGVERAADGTFRFDHKLQEGEYFTIEFAADVAARPIIPMPLPDKLFAATWKPTAEQLAMIPAVAIMTVRLHDRMGEEHASRRLRIQK